MRVFRGHLSNFVRVLLSLLVLRVDVWVVIVLIPDHSISIYFVKPGIYISDIKICKELIHSFIRQKPNYIMLGQKTFLLFINRKFQFMIVTRPNDHFTV